jgi:uncharacterized membrane protein
MSEPAEPIFLDEVLRPNPPMNARALALILGLVAVINIAFAVAFMLRGAWPIAPFMGADVVLLAWAFHASRVAARAFEHVRLTASELFVRWQSPRGNAHDMLLNPYWVTVHLEQPMDMPRKLTLRSHGKSVQIGSFLSPRERLSFAEALKGALAAARNWRPT